MFGGRYSRPVAANDGGETWNHDELLRQPLLRLLTEVCLLEHSGPLLVAASVLVFCSVSWRSSPARSRWVGFGVTNGIQHSAEHGWSDRMTQEDDVRRERDPITRRKAGILASVLVLLLAAVSTTIWLTHAPPTRVVRANGSELQLPRSLYPLG